VLRDARLRRTLAVLAVLFLGAFLAIHVTRDLQADVTAWYFHSTWVWLLVMLLATAIYAREYAKLRRAGVDTQARFASLPPG
jgi:hypothetical protein